MIKNYYNITGEDTTDIINIIKPGDIILRGFNTFLKCFLFTEYFDGCIYVGKSIIVKNNKNKIEYDNLISFLRCDDVIILRVDETKITNYIEAKEKAINRAHQFIDVSKEYDINFSDICDQNFEIPILCYKEFGFLKKYNFKKFKYLYDDFSLLNSSFFKVIYKKVKYEKR